MSVFAGQVAVVTGAAGGIGSAISHRLAADGATVCVVGRKPDRLRAVVQNVEEVGGHGLMCLADLLVASDIDDLTARIEQQLGAADILIHCAGVLSLGRVGEAGIEELDRQYQVNVRGAYALTSALLPMLKARRGQIVFMNSSVGLAARSGIGQYAASKHALRAIADSLREEVNPDRVRVLSVFLGRTATLMQAEVHRLEGRPYHPELLIQPTDVALLVAHVLALPRTVEVTEIQMRPLRRLG